MNEAHFPDDPSSCAAHKHVIALEMWAKKRIRYVFATTVAGVLTLSGCSAVGDIWASLDDDGIPVFALCDDVVISEFRVRVQGTEDPAWVVSGSEPFHPKDTIIYGETPGGMSSELDPADVSSVDTLVVSAFPQDEDKAAIMGVFNLNDVPGGGWLAADGGTAAAPCG